MASIGYKYGVANRRSNGGFNPLNIDGLQLYLNQSKGVNIVSIDRVQSWTDQSLNGFEFIQNTATAQPIKTANSIDFNGVDEILKNSSTGAFSGDTSGIFFFSFYYDGSNNGFIFSSCDESSFQSLFFIRYVSSTKLVNLTVRNSAGSISAIASVNQFSVGFNYGYVRSDGSKTFFKINDNPENQGSAISGSDAGNWFNFSNNRDNLVIGGHIRSTTTFAIEQINKIIYSNASLDSEKIDDIMDFMSNENN